MGYSATTMSANTAPTGIPYKILLVVTFSVVFCYVLVQMILTLRGKNKKQSFNFGFLLICILWVGVRLVYFIHFVIDDPNPSPFWDLANTAAVDVQFAALTFLMLFYVRMMLRMRWQAWRKRLSVLVIIINVLFDGFSVAIFIMQQLFTDPFPTPPAPAPAAHLPLDERAFSARVPSPAQEHQLSFAASAPSPAPNDDGFTNALENVFLVFSGVVFFILSVSMFVFGVRLFRLRDTDLAVNAKEIAIVTILLAVVFASRSTFDFVNTFDVTPLYYPTCGTKEDFQWLVFLLFVWWEAFPIVLILVTLAKSLYREQAVFGKRSKFEPNFGLFAEMDREPESPEDYDTMMLGSQTPPSSQPHTPGHESRQARRNSHSGISSNSSGIVSGGDTRAMEHHLLSGGVEEKRGSVSYGALEDADAECGRQHND